MLELGGYEGCYAYMDESLDTCMHGSGYACMALNLLAQYAQLCLF